MRYKIQIIFKDKTTKPLEFESKSKHHFIKELSELLDETVDEVNIKDKASNKENTLIIDPTKKFK